MSALSPKADMCGATRDVRYGPKADSCSAAIELLFDHLVGAVLDRLRHGDAECLRSPEVDDQLDFRCLLHRKIVGLLSLENPAGVDTDLTGRLRKAAAVAHKAAGDGKLTNLGHHMLLAPS